MAKRVIHEDRISHERWMVSYADFLTLLLAFFVVMYSVSQVNEGKYRVLTKTLTEAFNILANAEKRRQHDQDSVRPEASSPAADAQRLSRFHVQTGVKLYRERNYVQAAESFQRATEADPANHQAWHHFAQACSHHRRYMNQALPAIARACDLQPMNPTYLKLAGRLHAQVGLVERADWYYNQAITWGGEDEAVRQALEDLRKSSKKAGWGLFGKVG